MEGAFDTLIFSVPSPTALAISQGYTHIYFKVRVDYGHIAASTIPSRLLLELCYIMGFCYCLHAGMFLK